MAVPVLLGCVPDKLHLLLLLLRALRAVAVQAQQQPHRAQRHQVATMVQHRPFHRLPLLAGVVTQAPYFDGTVGN